MSEYTDDFFDIYMLLSNLECKIEPLNPNIYKIYLKNNTTNKDVAEIVIKEKPNSFELFVWNLRVYTQYQGNGYSMILMYIIAKKYTNKGYKYMYLTDTSSKGSLYNKLKCENVENKKKCNLEEILHITSDYLKSKIII